MSAAALSRLLEPLLVLTMPTLAVTPLDELRATATPAYDDTVRLYTTPILFTGDEEPVPPRPLIVGDMWMRHHGLVAWDGKRWVPQTPGGVTITADSFTARDETGAETFRLPTPDEKVAAEEGLIVCPACARWIKPRTDNTPVRHKAGSGAARDWCPGR